MKGTADCLIPAQGLVGTRRDSVKSGLPYQGKLSLWEDGGGGGGPGAGAGAGGPKEGNSVPLNFVYM